MWLQRGCNGSAERLGFKMSPLPVAENRQPQEVKNGAVTKKTLIFSQLF
jgi:hypothetical protein